jgi:hypothetical protein
MPNTTLDFDKETALSLQRRAAAEGRSPAEIIGAALREYLRQADSSQLPPGVGTDRSGRSEISTQAENTLKPESRKSLTPEQEAAYARLSSLDIDWGGKPITDRNAANAR